MINNLQGYLLSEKPTSYKFLFRFLYLSQEMLCNAYYFSHRQGATGDEIVDALIANSATFEKKTLFSQVIQRMKFSNSVYLGEKLILECFFVSTDFVMFVGEIQA